MDSRATSGIRLRCANPYRRTLLVHVRTRTYSFLVQYVPTKSTVRTWYRCRCLSTICASTMILFAPTISRIRHVSKTSVVFCYNCWLLLTVINFICYQAQASRKHHHVLLTIKIENLSTHDESTTWKAANCPASRCRFHRQSLQGRGRVCGSIESFLEKYWYRFGCQALCRWKWNFFLWLSWVCHCDWTFRKVCVIHRANESFEILAKFHTDNEKGTGA